MKTILTITAIAIAAASFSTAAVAYGPYEAAAFPSEASVVYRDAPRTTLEEIAAQDPALSIRSEGDVDTMVMLSDVLFASDSAALNPDAIGTLEGIASKLDGIAGLEISGHTDSVGSDSYNLTLGQKRADAVRAWMVSEGHLNAADITATSAGEHDPIAANVDDTGRDNPEGRAQNRRVEFHIVEPVETAALALTEIVPVQQTTVQ